MKYFTATPQDRLAAQLLNFFKINAPKKYERAVELFAENAQTGDIFECTAVRFILKDALKYSGIKMSETSHKCKTTGCYFYTYSLVSKTGNEFSFLPEPFQGWNDDGSIFNYDDMCAATEEELAVQNAKYAGTISLEDAADAIMKKYNLKLK